MHEVSAAQELLYCTIMQRTCGGPRKARKPDRVFGPFGNIEGIGRATGRGGL
jgi:hypothetical protein